MTNQRWSPTRGVQHFREAIEGMATGAGPLSRRVLDAYAHHLGTLLDDQIPPYDDSRAKFAQLKTLLPKLRDDPDEKSARSAANLILEIYKTTREHAPNLEAQSARRELEQLHEEIARLKGLPAEPR